MPTDYALETPGSLMRAVSPFREMGAYEALWSEVKASFKWMADKFRVRHAQFHRVLAGTVDPDSKMLDTSPG